PRFCERYENVASRKVLYEIATRIISKSSSLKAATRKSNALYLLWSETVHMIKTLTKINFVRRTDFVLLVLKASLELAQDFNPRGFEPPAYANSATSAWCRRQGLNL